jgi:hypothetical protein
MKKELADAIKLIEDAGGFVMMQGDLEDQVAPMTESRLEELEAEQRKHFEEYQQRKRECFKEFDELLGRKDFSFSKVEDLCYEHGMDLDDIEEYIHGHY